MVVDLVCSSAEVYVHVHTPLLSGILKISSFSFIPLSLIGAVIILLALGHIRSLSRLSTHSSTKCNSLTMSTSKPQKAVFG